MKYVRSHGMTAIWSNQPYQDVEKTALKVQAKAAWERMRTGAGTKQDWDALAWISNACLIRGEKIDPLCVEMCGLAQDALISIRARYDRLGKFGVDAEALENIPPLIDFYSDLLDLSTPKQMQNAVMESVKRIRKIVKK